MMEVLHRIIRVGSSGWEYEADQRHAEILIKTLNMEHANPVCTLGEEDRWMKGKKKEDAFSTADTSISSHTATSSRASFCTEGLERRD